MQKKITVQITEEEAAILSELRSSSELKEDLQSIFQLANAKNGILTADEAEEKLIEDVRALGRKTLASWASKREEQIVQQARDKGKKLQQREKKSSTGGARSDESK